MQLQLSQSIIRKAIPKTSNRCPVALTLKSHEQISHANVGINSTNIILNRTTYQLTNDDPLFRFIRAFDNKKEVEPGTITIDIANEYIHYKPESEAH